MGKAHSAHGLEYKTPLERHRHRRKIGIKMKLGETGFGGGAWIGFIWLRIGTGGGLL
jgi:hypothetical protein